VTQSSDVLIGRLIQQPGGFRAFVPEKFPPEKVSFGDPKLVKLLSEADLALGRLDGLTQGIPDLNFFMLMYMKKESALSSQIEGTQARLTDALYAETGSLAHVPADVSDILRHIKSMNAGLEMLERLPLSLRLIKETHKVLLTDARSDFFPHPGEFRKSQNWILGTSPADARFVPPPPEYVLSAMSDLEKFFYSHEEIPILIKAGLCHAQFETIHPFLDGNGRTGRLLITLFLCQQEALKKPILYLSAYFKKHRELYFELLNGYRKGHVVPWVEFFLKSIAWVAKEATQSLNKILALKERDMHRVSGLGKASKYSFMLLKHLYKLPIVNVKKIQEFTGLSREGANGLVKRLADMGLLRQSDKSKTYGRIFVYKEYLDIFESKQG